MSSAPVPAEGQLVVSSVFDQVLLKHRNAGGFSGSANESSEGVFLFCFFFPEIHKIISVSLHLL